MAKSYTILDPKSLAAEHFVTSGDDPMLVTQMSFNESGVLKGKGKGERVINAIAARSIIKDHLAKGWETPDQRTAREQAEKAAAEAPSQEPPASGDPAAFNQPQPASAPSL